MLSNLKAEYVRKGITPYKGVMEALQCSEKTARNKLEEKYPITIPEALTIRNTDFAQENFSLEYLFESSDEQKTA